MLCASEAYEVPSIWKGQRLSREVDGMSVYVECVLCLACGSVVDAILDVKP